VSPLILQVLVLSVSCVALPASASLVSQEVQKPPVPVSRTLMQDLENADAVAKQGDAAGAIKLYEAAAARARSEHNPVLEGQALTRIGRLLSTQAKYVEARQYQERAIALAESAGDNALASQAANSMGAIAYYLGSANEARTWYEKAIKFADSAGNVRLKAMALDNLSRLAVMTEAEKLAISSQVTEIARTLGDKHLEADALHGWADHLFISGDYAAAMEKLESAAALYRELSNNIDLARVYTSMGRLNRMHGRPAAAIPLYESALQLQKQAGDKLGVIQSLNAMAIAYGVLGNRRRERELYEQAYALALETNSPRVIDFIRANLADLLFRDGEYARVAELLEEVLRRSADSNIPMRHAQLARAYLHMGRLDEARLHADEGVKLTAAKPSDHIRTLYIRAAVRGRMNDSSNAMEDVREALRLIEELRAKLVPLDFMKEGFSGQYQYIYSTMIELYERQGQPEPAIEAAEEARARAFLDLLATRDVRLKQSSDAAVEELRRTEQQLRRRGVDPYKAVAAGAAARNLDAETAALLASWQKASPQIQSFVSVRPQTARQLVATAKRLQSTILSYWTAEDAVFIGVVKPEGAVQLKRANILLSRLSDLVDATLNPAADRSAAAIVPRGTTARAGNAGAASEWQELYRLLIEPVRSLLPPAGGRLTIIPHGPLMRLSFAALADANHRYLVEQYALHYIPAAALLDFTSVRSSTQPAGNRKYLFVADPELPPARKGESSMPQLPGARDEVRAIAKMIPAGTAVVLEGREADRSAVLSSLQRASVLHFATHAVMIDDQPLDSYLALARPGGTQGTGRLAAEDIYGLDLNADLVVLSSCRSGGGKVTGEGISALARAFFYAGAPSIIASRWDVPDQPAARLLASFYSEWLKGRSRVEALRTAQMRLLADLRAGRVILHTPAGDLVLPEDPSLWAGFILLGEI
jgi:CHAT domain-containing protein